MTGPELTREVTSAPSAVPRRLYAVGLADSIGLGMYLAFSAVYLHLAIGLPDYQIGLALGVSGVASVIGALPLAILAQRMGLRRSLILYFFARAFSYAALAVAVNSATAFAALAVAGLLSRGTGPLVQAVSVQGEESSSAGAVQALARLRLLRNAGMAIGSFPAAAAVALSDEWALRAVMLGCATMFVLCSALSWGLPRSGDIRRPVQGGKVGRDIPFLAVTAAYGALILSAILLGVGMPLWIVQQTAAPTWAAGFVSFVNTALVVGLQIRVSRGSEDGARARRMMIVGALLAAVGSAVAPLSSVGGHGSALVTCVVTVILLTFAELYISAGSMGLALVHTPTERRATYLATYNLGFAVATVVGPLLVTLSLSAGPSGWFGWTVAFSLTAVAVRFLPLTSR